MESKPVKESPYVHRYTAYIKDLTQNWAYVDTKRTPGVKFRERNNPIAFPSFFVQKNKEK